MVAFLVAKHGLGSCGAWLRCSAACAIFPDQGLNPYLLHWQADSLQLSHQGTLETEFLIVMSLNLTSQMWIVDIVLNGAAVV